MRFWRQVASLHRPRYFIALIVMLVGVVASASAAAAPGVVRAWGANGTGQLGSGSIVSTGACGGNPCVASPAAVTGLSGVTAISASESIAYSPGCSASGDGAMHGLALLSNGTVMAWGANGCGQLGDGTTTNSDVPIQVKDLSGVTAIAAGGEYSLALLSNGTVMAWGANENGQLGVGDTTGPSTCASEACSTIPVVVRASNGGPLGGVTAISAGGWHSLALLSNGAVEAWGDAPNTDESLNGQPSPAPVSGLSGVTAIAAGGGFSLALLSNRTVMAWGENYDGQLGNGTSSSADSTTPAPVDGLGGVTAIAAGYAYSLALLQGGAVMGWGDNEWGELGDGLSTGPDTCTLETPAGACATRPVPVSGVTGASAISASGGDYQTNWQSLALRSNGTVMAWGGNLFGQLGTGATAGPSTCNGYPCSTTPVEVSGLTAATAISAGGEFNLALVPPPPPPSNVFEIPRIVCGVCQVIPVLVLVPGPGVVSVQQAPSTTHDRALSARTNHAKPLIVRTTATARKAERLRLELKLTAAGKRALRKKSKLRVNVLVTYTPTGGRPADRTITVTFRPHSKHG